MVLVSSLNVVLRWMFLVSGKHNYVSLSTDPSAVVPADDMHYVNHCYKVLSVKLNVYNSALISLWTSAHFH